MCKTPCRGNPARMAVVTTEPVHLPPAPRVPRIVQGIAFLIAQHAAIAAVARRYGSAFTLNVPVFGRAVVISESALVRELFCASGDLVGRPTHNLGALLGPGSMFSLDGDELHERRRLVRPPFQGVRARSHERIVEEEVLREIASWPQGREFPTLPSMSRITLRAIVRAMLGGDGAALDELCELMPAAVRLGSRIGLLPPAAARDFGPWSPGGRYVRYRRRIDAVVGSLVAAARADPALQERDDLVALLLRARDDNGRPIPDRHVVNELVTLVVSGHETTSAALAWAVERLRRHPRLLSRLTDEADAGGCNLRQATIWEVQRTRPVITGGLRWTKTRIRLGQWVIPPETLVIASIQLAHESDTNFPDATSFEPDRFTGATPKPFAWIAFGGGMNRCIGSAFANMEMDVTLRTLLREFRFAPTDAPCERRQNRGVAIVPSRGGRAVVYRRATGTAAGRVSHRGGDGCGGRRAV